MIGGLILTSGLTIVLYFFSLNLPGNAVPARAGGTTRYVATTGNDASNDCLDSNNPCRTVQNAIDSANSGDTIQVGAGEFTGTVLINKNLLLLGMGQELTSIDGGGISSVIQVEINSTSAISGMTILNGHAYEGGGLLNLGNLHIINTTLANNIADAHGGAVKNSGTMTITNSLIYANTASRGNIYNQGILQMTGSTVKENLALMDGGGIFNYGYTSSSATMTVTQSNISQNIAKNGGGGIANYGNLTLFNSSIISNTSNAGSSSDQGGGIYNAGSLFIQNAEISGNSAYEGAGIYQYDYPAPNTTLINVSIINNYPLPDTSDSKSKAGITTVGGDISIQNSIIAENKEKNCYRVVTSQGTGTITSLGNNLSDDDSCDFAATGDLENVVPKLGSFQSQNLVWFHALSVDSPAIDHGSNAACPSVDIRDKTRPRDGDFDGILQCDIGAYELVLPPLQIVAPSIGQINTTIDIEARVTVVTLTTPITFNWFISEYDPMINTSDYIDNISLEWPTTGTKMITVQATGSDGTQVTGTKTLEIVYMQFLPTVLTPFAPEAGFWDMEDGYFYVTLDRKYISEFSIFVYIPNCDQVVRIYTTELVPIINNSSCH